MKKIFPIIIILAIIAIIFISLSKKEKMITVYNGNTKQLPLDLNLHHLQDPECKMVIDDISHATQVASKSGKSWVFDDIGCMVLWLKDKDTDGMKLWVYAQDSKKWIDAQKAFYTFDESTPMHHGFGAYEHKKGDMISFEEVKKRVLRGEDLTNPIIRKKVLGR